MKTKLISILFCIAAITANVTPQNVVKLFNAVPIGATDMNVVANQYPYGSYQSAEVYLSCPTESSPRSSITGPNGGELVTDNYLTVNDQSVCPLGNCFNGTLADPMTLIGSPMEAAYNAVEPLNISSVVAGTGSYTFNLIDYGYTYGNSDIFLNTSCTIIPVYLPVQTAAGAGDQVCHRDNGKRGQRTLTVGASAVAAHVRHGDTAGPCN